MHCPGSRPRASSMVRLMAAMASPAMAAASAVVKSSQASTFRGGVGFSERPHAARTASSSNGMERRKGVITWHPSWVRPGFYPLSRVVAGGSERAARRRPAPRGLRDLNPAALRRLALRQGDGDLEDAVLEVGLRLLGVDPLRQGDGAVEVPVAPLATVEALLALLALLPPLPLEDEGIVADLDVDVLLPRPWQVGADDQLAVPLTHLDLRIPEALAGGPAEVSGARGQARPAAEAAAIAEEVVAEAVHVADQIAHQAEGIPEERSQRGERRLLAGENRRRGGGGAGAPRAPRARGAAGVGAPRRGADGRGAGGAGRRRAGLTGRRGPARLRRARRGLGWMVLRFERRRPCPPLTLCIRDVSQGPRFQGASV